MKKESAVKRKLACQVPIKSSCLNLCQFLGKRKYFPGSPPPCEDPSTKQPKSCEKEHKFTPDRSQESLGTQSRPAARKSLKIASLSPSKRSKRPCRAIGSPRSPSCSSPKSNASSPLGGDTCKRRRRGGELSKEFQVRWSYLSQFP